MESANPAECLHNNMNANAGQRPNLPNGDNQRSMQACLQAGGNVASCMHRGGGQSGPRMLGAGPPGDPRDQIKDPRGVASLDTTDMELDIHGVVVSQVTTHHDAQGRRTGQDTVTRIRMGRNEYAEFRHHTDTHGHDTPKPTRIVTYDPDSDPTSQAAPEGSNAGEGNGCPGNRRDLLTGKCIFARPTGKGMTSQPGPDGENPGASPGSGTPHIGSEAVTNPGDGSWEVRGSGSGHHGTPLDMTEGGTKVPGGGDP